MNNLQNNCAWRIIYERKVVTALDRPLYSAEIDNVIVETGLLQTARLGDVAEIQMGYPFRSRLRHNQTGDVAVIQMKDLDEAEVRVDRAIRMALPDLKVHHLLRPGDLLFRSRGESNEAALVPERIGIAVVAAPILRMRPRLVQPEYLCWCLNSAVVQSQLAAVAAGTSVRMVSAESLKAVQIPVPPESVQRQVAAIAGLVGREQVLLARIAAERQRLTTHLLIEHSRRMSRKATS